MKQNVVLTGFMGTGKSTVGRLLAQKLGLTFVDTDDWIETRNGRSIPHIFQTEGEAVFRAYEREAAQILAQQTGLVIATGGGMLVDALNAKSLQSTGTIFCLTAPVDEILRRVEADEKRPLLNHPNRRERIEQLLTARATVYAQFTQIDTNGKPPTEIMQEILPYLQ